MSERLPPRIGQVWKDRESFPECVFVVMNIWEKHYPAKGNKPAASRTRVTGVLTCGEDCHQPDRDLDLESMYKMFPYILFNPREQSSEYIDDEDK